jgi:hypothetical protein
MNPGGDGEEFLRHQNNALDSLNQRLRIKRNPLSTRRICFAGCLSNPDEHWILQVTRNPMDSEDGFPEGKRYLLMDRDTKYSEAFCSMLKGSDVEPAALSNCATLRNSE